MTNFNQAKAITTNTMRKQKSTTDKLNQLSRVSSYLTKEQYYTQLGKIFTEWETKVD